MGAHACGILSTPEREQHMKTHPAPFFDQLLAAYACMRTQIDTYKKNHTHAEKIVQIPVWTEQQGGNKK